MTCPISKRDIPRLALVWSLAALVWLSVNGLWSATAWQSPASYSVDALETMARFKSSAEKGAVLPFAPMVDRLGAPWGADWSAYLMPDAPWYWFVGVLVRGFGLVPASHLAMGTAHLAAVAALFLCARLLGHRPIVAAGSALLFGFSYYICYRGLSHHSFALIFIVPGGLLVAALVARSRRLLARPAVRTACLGIAALAGTGNPYLIFMFFLLLGWALLWQLVSGRRRLNLAIGLGCVVTCAATFTAVNFPALRAAAQAKSHAFQRHADDATIYALRLPQLITSPPNHRWPTAAQIGLAEEKRAAGRSEHFSPYLGVVGAAGLVVMLLGAARSIARSSSRKWRPDYAVAGVWILTFALAGGINTWLAEAGLTVFRAGNRYSIHLLALALLCLSAWASRRLAARPKWLAMVLVLPITALGLWDQVPADPGEITRAALRDAAEGDRLTAERLEKLLPPNAAVFQLPVMPFPEAGPRGAMSDYEHLRPYLHSSTLRFSYGAMRDTRAQCWAERMGELPPATMVTRLREAGFAALWIDRRGYADHAAFLVAGLQPSGLRKITLPESLHVALYVLPSSAASILPNLSEVRWHPPWNKRFAGSEAEVTAHAMDGWFDEENAPGRHWRWAGREAELGLWNDTVTTRTVVLSLDVGSPASGAVELWREGTLLHRFEFIPPARAIATIELNVPPGSTRLKLKFNGRLTEPPGDPRQLGFSLENLTLDIR